MYFTGKNLKYFRAQMQDYISPDIAYSFLIFNYKENLESFFLSKTISNIRVKKYVLSSSKDCWAQLYYTQNSLQ